MKRLVLLMFALALLMGTNTTIAQTTCPNTPDEHLVPWIDKGCYATTLDLSGRTCEVEICYCTREHYDSYGNLVVDYVVKSVRVLDGSCPPSGDVIGVVTDIMSKAELKLIKDNREGVNYAPCPDAGSIIVRAWRVNCWSRTEVYNEELQRTQWLMGPCNSNVNCYRKFSVCSNGPSQAPTVTLLQSGTMPGIEWCEAPCFSICPSN